MRNRTERRPSTRRGISGLHVVCLLAIVSTLLLSACGEDQVDSRGEVPEEAAQGVLSVFTVSYPLQYFAERIGGGLIEVAFPAPEDVDPAYWSPTAETVAAYQQADLILLNGAGYAGWVQRASLPQSRLVDTSAALGESLLPLDEGMTHIHGPEGEHSHKGHAFTTWLDPALAVMQARAVADALSAARPDLEGSFRHGFEGLEGDLVDLDGRLAAAAAEIGDAPMLFSHPVYQYLIGRYGMNGRSVHWEPDQLPDEAMWGELGEILGSHPAGWMIWEGEPLGETVKRLEAMGIASVVFDPCGNRPQEGDYLAVMSRNLESLAGLISG